jgi:hypothetical protein
LGEPQAPPEKKVLFVAAKIEDQAADRYLWAAEMAALRMKGKTEVLPGGLVAALQYSREKPGEVAGIVEIMVDVYSWREEVRITCFDNKGKSLWKEKAVVNTGGSEESLARRMVERAIKKAEDRPACGSR